MSKKRTNWSGDLNRRSVVLDLEPGAFTRDEPEKIAASLRNSALSSTNRKAGPFQSAMSMLNFYINRAGRNLPAAQRARLEAAKDELRALFGRPRHDSARVRAPKPDST